MYRHRHWFLALGAILLLNACSGDDENQPPRAVIVYPENEYHFTSAPDSAIVEASDDRGVLSVEIRLEDEVISTRTTTPYSTSLPLGIYADGRRYKLNATATDNQGARGEAGAVYFTVDPALQTVPQVMAVADAEGVLEITWLTFPNPNPDLDEDGEPDQPVIYEWELARDDGFFEVVASGAVTDTTVVSEVTAAGVAYARVRAQLVDSITNWSRSGRFSGLDTWRRNYNLPGQQLGTAILTGPDGNLRLLSHAVDRHRVSTAPVQLLVLDAEQALVETVDLLPDTYQPTTHQVTADDRLVLAGWRDGDSTFLAASTLDGQLLWDRSTGFMYTTALLAEPSGALWTAGRDLREGQLGGVVATVAEDGTATAAVVFPLEAGRDVLWLWPHAEGGFVLAGSLPDTYTEAEPETPRPGGIWAQGIDAAGAVRWDLRLGTGANWLGRGANTDGAGNFVISGIAFVPIYTARYGFLASFDERGHLRWQFTDREWHLFADIVPGVGGRWTAAGARRRSVGDLVWEYDFGLRGFTAYGLPLWEAQHRDGAESQGWSLAPHPLGGWWAVGMRTGDRVNYDLSLLRADDRGELD